MRGRAQEILVVVDQDKSGGDQRGRVGQSHACTTTNTVVAVVNSPTCSASLTAAQRLQIRWSMTVEKDRLQRKHRRRARGRFSRICGSP